MGRPRQISDDEIKQIRNLYSQGKSCNEVSVLTGWSSSTVMIYVENPRDAGRKPKLTVQQIQDLNRQYASGLTYRELTGRFSLSESQVGRYIWKPRKKWAWIAEKRKKTALESSQENCPTTL